MRVVIAPDSFKESLTAMQAAEAMRDGVWRVLPEATCVLVPMSDGGEGFAVTVAEALGGSATRREVSVTGPVGEPVEALLVLHRHEADGTSRSGTDSESQPLVATCDVASAVGLGLVHQEQRNVMRADSAGVGELLLAALEAGVQEIVLGLGGSATNDGGSGMLRALGARFVDASGEELPPGPEHLAELHSADLSGVDERLAETRIRLASDVSNPLTGPEGASATFGPQKGASEEQVERLDALLSRYVEVLDGAEGLPPGTAACLASSPGAGAAGGLGFALQLLGARFERGVDVVAELVGLDAALEDADLVLVGEGSLDGQTLNGKAPFGVAEHAAPVPVIGFGGRLGPGHEKLLDAGFVALVPIVQGVTDLETALAEADDNLRAAVATAMRLVTARTP